jgi:hypothetical protein
MTGDLDRHRVLTMAHRIGPKRRPRFAAIALSAVVLALILAGCGASPSTVTYGPGAGAPRRPRLAIPAARTSGPALARGRAST